MSLLNDALRKKQGEQSARNLESAKTMFPAMVLSHGKKGYRAIVRCAAVMFAVGLLAWWLWSPGQVASMQAGQQPAGFGADAATAAREQEPAPQSSSSPADAQGAPDRDVALLGGTSTAPPASLSQTQLPVKPVPHAPLPEPAASTPSPTPAALPAPKQSAQVPFVSTAKAPRASAGLVVPTPSSHAGPVSADGLYEKARSYHRHQRLQEAIGMYREVLKRSPGHFDAAFNLTSAYLQTGVFDQAYTIASDLNLRAPGDARILLNLAVAEIGRGRPREALDLLERSAGLPQPPLYEIYFHKGIACRQIGETDQSLLWYRKAEGIKADDPDLLFNLAVALDVKGSYGTAADYYQRYLQIAVDVDTGIRGKVLRRIRDLRSDLSAGPGKDE